MPHPPLLLRPLLEALADPGSCASYKEFHWDRVIPLARRSRLLGVLAHRIAGVLDSSEVPARVNRHLRAGITEARFRRQKALHLLHVIAPILKGHQGPWVLLKGAAYVAQDFGLAQGRLPADVDLMIPRPALADVERALLRSGWEFEKTEAYDQHYYRAWSHQLPPMRAAGQVLELDLHHTILPPVGRIKVDTARLFADAVAVSGSPFHVLSLEDQVLHAVVHLAHDSDFAGRLRDLVDVDGLFRLLPLTDPERRRFLVDRARLHGMERPLRMAASLCGVWFRTPGCSELMNAASSPTLVGLYGAAVVRLASRVIGPGDPESGAIGDALARLALESRAHWLRMPPWLLAYHGGAKAFRALARRASPRSRKVAG